MNQNEIEDKLRNLKISSFSGNKKLISIGAAILLIIILIPMLIGNNTAGDRTVIQYPWGSMNIKFSPGPYMSWFGPTETYKDVTTFDFDKGAAHGGATLDQSGIALRYQDGGTGTIFGKIRFSLPGDFDQMLAIHKAFRTNEGLAYKLLKPVTEEAENRTAELMTSEEAYAEKRATFTEWSKAQIVNGPYITKLTQIHDLDDATGKRVLRNIPVIDYAEDGRPRHAVSDLKKYGIMVSGYQLTDWGFEDKTLDQISLKREASMAIITAKANAERAKQESITAVEDGKKNVTVARYAKMVEKETATVEAQQRKEVATIQGEQKVLVAEQNKLEAEQNKLAAAEYKQERILRGEGDSSYKKLVMQADGALQQRLAAYVTVNSAYANAIAKQKWVPEIQMGGGEGGTGNAAQALIDMFAAKTAKEINLDMKMSAAQ